MRSPLVAILNMGVPSVGRRQSNVRRAQPVRELVGGAVRMRTEAHSVGALVGVGEGEHRLGGGTVAAREGGDERGSFFDRHHVGDQVPPHRVAARSGW
jgi:hypothetical protein